MNHKDYYKKLKQWETEGYDVSELRERWFPTEKQENEESGSDWRAADSQPHGSLESDQGQIDRSGTLCYNCGASLGKGDSITCHACSKTYCSNCEIFGIACPNCGNPARPINKLKCVSCGEVFGIPSRDKDIVERLDQDTEHSVKQRCTCPICKQTVYYSGSFGFQDLGNYEPDDILQDFHNGSLTLTTLQQFKAE